MLTLQLYNIPQQFQNQAKIYHRFRLNKINYRQLINFNNSHQHLPVTIQAATSFHQIRNYFQN